MIERSFNLIIAEKPEAARRIASALGHTIVRKHIQVEYYEVQEAFDGGSYAVCAAAGHLYGVGDLIKKRRIYPVFDVEWFPSDLLRSSANKWKSRGKRFSNFSLGRINAIRFLAHGAEKIIHACDYDLEGETIGYNIILYACSYASRKKSVYRARFSALTESDIRKSFSNLQKFEPMIAEAGRTRHVIDFLWGINLSRAISEAYRTSSSQYRNLSIGRVQGPTLAFVVNRDIEMNTHVPIPYWTITCTLEKDGSVFEAFFEENRINVKREAEEKYNLVSTVKLATVRSVEKEKFKEHPPFPFNIGDLQRECFRKYKLSPSSTLSISEMLYLQALISYPRTNSQKLPPSIGYSKIIISLLEQAEYKQYREQLKDENRRKYPVQGFLDDPAHPAIYPTGVPPRLGLPEAEKKVYDLIVRRFLSCFAEDAEIGSFSATFQIGNSNFVSKGIRILKAGWRGIYPLPNFQESNLPELEEGEKLKVVSVFLNSKSTEAPRPYTQASLLEKMNTENIGTKATRAETIATLLDRGYLSEARNRTLASTNFGLALVDSLEPHCSELFSVDLTRKTEEKIESIESGKDNACRAIYQNMIDVLKTLEKIHVFQTQIGSDLQLVSGSAASGNKIANSNRYPRGKKLTTRVVGSCPSCGSGFLRVIRSRKTGKRFLGCSNFPSGCLASAPLPKRGMISASRKLCKDCGWPMLSIRFSFNFKKSPWQNCPNTGCPSKQNKVVVAA